MWLNDGYLPRAREGKITYFTMRKFLLKQPTAFKATKMELEITAVVRRLQAQTTAK
jgi:hypothetical protein